MYKIMIVDDEPIVRIAVKSLVDWEKNGFRMEIEASNGKQAMKLLEDNQDIDIIITDINMPVMDGLELISEVSKRGFSLQIIVLSAYNDYEWVRRAFKLGVNDYILKNEIEPEGLLELVTNVASKIDSKKKNIDNIKNKNRNVRYEKDVLLKELLEKGSKANLSDSYYNGLRICRNSVAICYLWIDDYQTVKEKYVSSLLKPFTQSVVNVIDEVLSITNSGEVLCQSPEEFTVFLAFDELSQKQIRERMLDIIGRLQYSLKTYVNISASVGVSDVRNNNDSIADLFTQAQQNAKFRFVLGKGKIIFPEAVNTIMWNKEGLLGDIQGTKKESIIGKEEDFLNALGAIDEEKTNIELEKLLKIIRKNSHHKIEKIYSCYMELIFVTISYLSKIGKETYEIFGSEIDFYEKILRFETQDEIDIWMRNMISWILNYLKESKTPRQNRVISKAKQFIQANYSNSGLSLKMVSDYVELSESHFSTSFTREVKETFTDYLTEVRIEKAKELIISTNLKLYEISERVGYLNAEHFSRIFKKTVGCSPKDYMKE